MTIAQGVTNALKLTALQPLTSATLKLALYTAEANLDETTTVYTTAGEVVGDGYTAGGKTLTNVTVNVSGRTVYLNFDDVEWNPASFTARAALIYNQSSGNAAVAVLDFGADKTAVTSFLVQLPPDNAASALVRIS